MYLALWLDDDQSAPRDRIVMVRPLLKKETAAVALLRSAKREDADSMILSGDIEGLNQFARYVDAADDEWTSHDNERLLDALRVVAEKAGCSIVPFGDQPGHAAARYITAALKQPRVGLYPRFITKEGKKVWDEVLQHYKKTIAKYKADKQRMWAAAIIIYKRVAGQRGIKAFNKYFGDKDRSKTVTDAHRRINRGNFKALKEISKAAGTLEKAGLGTRLTNEKFFESAEHNGRFYITTFQVQNTKDSTAALQYLADKAWGTGTGKYLHRAVDQYTDILAEPTGPKKLYYYVATHLTRDMVAVLFPTLQNADKQTITRTLAKAGRRWVKTGTMKAIASVDLELGPDDAFIREVLAKLWFRKLAATGRYYSDRRKR